MALLDDASGRATAAATTPEMLAAGLGATTFMPRRILADPEIASLARCFAHDDGITVLPDTVRYLHERADDETGWLERLSGIDVDTTLIWGLHDSVAPLRVANHVWQTYLKPKPGRNRYWVVPGADHYVQCDAPSEVARIIRLSAGTPHLELQTIGDRARQPRAGRPVRRRRSMTLRCRRSRRCRMRCGSRRAPRRTGRGRERN